MNKGKQIVRSNMKETIRTFYKDCNNKGYVYPQPCSSSCLLFDVTAYILTCKQLAFILDNFIHTNTYTKEKQRKHTETAFLFLNFLFIISEGHIYHIKRISSADSRAQTLTLILILLSWFMLDKKKKKTISVSLHTSLWIYMRWKGGSPHPSLI